MNNKPGAIMRIVAGGYLFYLGVQLIRQLLDARPSNMTLMMAFGVLFLVFGCAIAFMGLRGFLRITKEEKLEEVGEGIEDISEEDEKSESAMVDLEQPEAKLENLEDLNKPEVDIMKIEKPEKKDVEGK